MGEVNTLPHILAMWECVYFMWECVYLHVGVCLLSCGSVFRAFIITIGKNTTNGGFSLYCGGKYTEKVPFLSCPTSLIFNI